MSDNRVVLFPVAAPPAPVAEDELKNAIDRVWNRPRQEPPDAEESAWMERFLELADIAIGEQDTAQAA